MLALLPDWSINYVPLILFGLWALVRPWRRGDVWGWLAVLTAVVSPMLSRLFTLADDIETARELWHIGLVLLLLMYAGILSARLNRFGHLLVGFLVAGAVGFAYSVDLHSAGQNRHIITAFLMTYIAYTVVMIFASFKPGRLFERGAWATRCGGEIFALFEFWLCVGAVSESESWLAENWGATAPKYICGRAMADWWPTAPLLVTSLFLAWLIIRYGSERRSS